ncbi:hypothetical protein GBAR_LOCUS6945 [Geodia barretti]|uniref:Uncharacterized protein n=1 Tax=Geodia barretti TaxID=519541 RepID=A0AA35RHS4_GEOBA|nr:hypothetical protein GBAR_LOCUS6945 [Geodia barretti]
MLVEQEEEEEDDDEQNSLSYMTDGTVALLILKVTLLSSAGAVNN